MNILLTWNQKRFSVCTDELQDDIEPKKNEHICEGNEDIEFNPLLIRHKGVYTNFKGTYVQGV